jgi:flagellar hook-associated protein 1
MSLSSAFNIINSSFGAIGTQSATIASNIANANNTGYTRQTANVGTDAFGGVAIFSTTRDANDALSARLNSANSDSAAQAAISQGLSTLAQTVSDSYTATSTGTLQNGISPLAMIGNLTSALATYQASPDSAPAAQAAVAAAKDLASSLNSGAKAVSDVRTQADQAIAQAVTQVNSLLQQFESVNNAIVSGTATGLNVSGMQDTRDSLVSQIAKQIGVNTAMNPNGSMSIFSDTGVPLFNTIPFKLSFTASGQLGAGATGGQVYINGTPITGSGSNMPLQSGAIAGLVQLRDTIAPQYQAQLDQIAGNLISAFQETDQTGSGLPALPGLFTTTGATSVPGSSSWTGIASAIIVNPNVDATQGGHSLLLRDGGIADPTTSNYTYNTTGAAGYTGRLQQLSAALRTPMNFASSAGLGASATLSDYAQSSVSWLQGANQQADANATYQSSLATQASSALSNATGVNLDVELTHMLSIESSYTASAKLMTTVNDMLKTLLSAV